MEEKHRECMSSDDDSGFMKEVTTTIVSCLGSLPRKQDVLQSKETMDGKGIVPHCYFKYM